MTRFYLKLCLWWPCNNDHSLLGVNFVSWGNLSREEKQIFRPYSTLIDKIGSICHIPSVFHYLMVL